MTSKRPGRKWADAPIRQINAAPVHRLEYVPCSAGSRPSSLSGIARKQCPCLGTYDAIRHQRVAALELAHRVLGPWAEKSVNQRLISQQSRISAFVAAHRRSSLGPQSLMQTIARCRAPGA